MEILGRIADSPGIAVSILLLVGGVYAWFRIRRQVRMISKAMFGTPSLAEGLERQADILAETPKSVSGMTKLCLPQIEADFPEFHWPQWRQMCENMLKAYLTALSSQDLTVLGGEGLRGWQETGSLEALYGKSRFQREEGRNGGTEVSVVSQELKKQAELLIEDQKRRGIRENYRQVKIHQTEISRYQREAGMCIIKLQSAVEYYYEETKAADRTEGEDEKEGNRAEAPCIEPDRNESKNLKKAAGGRQKARQKLEKQTKNRKQQTRYNMELVYIQDLSKVKDLATSVGVTCPNCGAPITRLGSKFCEYCGTGVTPIDVRVWKLHRVEKENC